LVLTGTRPTIIRYEDVRVSNVYQFDRIVDVPL